MLGAAAGALGALAALVAAASMAGFTVDDALISVRYAQNLRGGHGWRFLASGPLTDGVTPLPWPPVLALLGGEATDALTLLRRAQILGILSLAVGTGALAAALAKAGVSARMLALAGLLLAVNVPLGAWAGAGMETGVVTGLTSLAVAALVTERPRVAAILAGLSAAFRPELAPWALVLMFWGSRPARVGSPLALEGLGPRLGEAVVATIPFALCVAVRLVVFRHPAPLALAAKPSDVAHGVAYAGAAAVVTLAPVVAFAPRALHRGGLIAQALAFASLLHLVVVALVGGDWMPYARLAVPVIPPLLAAAALAARSVPSGAERALTAVRFSAALVVAGYVLVVAAPAGRQVVGHREDLITRARVVLAGRTCVAAIDVGWVSAAVPRSVALVDLAGLTDPDIAVLRGGHTSKAVDPGLLLGRGTDTLVFYAARRPPEPLADRWWEAPFTRRVEQRLAMSPLLQERFRGEAFLPLGDSGAGYVVATRR